MTWVFHVAPAGHASFACRNYPASGPAWHSPIIISHPVTHTALSDISELISCWWLRVCTPSTPTGCSSNPLPLCPLFQNILHLTRSIPLSLSFNIRFLGHLCLGLMFSEKAMFLCYMSTKNFHFLNVIYFLSKFTFSWLLVLKSITSVVLSIFSLCR